MSLRADGDSGSANKWNRGSGGGAGGNDPDGGYAHNGEEDDELLSDDEDDDDDDDDEDYYDGDDEDDYDHDGSGAHGDSADHDADGNGAHARGPRSRRAARARARARRAANASGSGSGAGASSATAAKSAADAALEGDAALRDKRWLVQRRVIDEAMIREAVREELFADYDRIYVPEPGTINLREVTTLILSFRSIDCINNLHGFEALVKLQLDNNVIERIQNLEHLVNLRWLDLSFNFITSIEGLDKLTQLTDLSLFNNRIKTLGTGLSKLTNLTVLSVGNNEISDLEQLKQLRRFRALRVLTLKGNPVCAQDDCRHTVLAFVDQLKYLDYELIDPRQVREAYDKKMEHVLELRAKEQEEAELAAVAATAEQRRAELRRVGMDGVDSLFDSIVMHDKDLAKLTALPGTVQVLGAYRARFEEVVRELQADALLQFRRKQVEETAMRTAMDALVTANANKLVGLIQAFEHRKKVVFRAPQRDSLVALKRAAVELSDALMDVEMRTVKDVSQVIAEFVEVYTKLSKDSEGRIAKCFALVTEAAKQCERDLLDHLHELTDRLAKDDMAASAWPREVVALVNDKDAVTTLISAAHDFQCAQILKAEEDVRLAEERGTEGLLRTLQQGEYARNRKRVSEIYELCERYVTAINEQGRALIAAKAGGAGGAGAPGANATKG